MHFVSAKIEFAMKLLFSGDSGCTRRTITRLMIVAEELGFMDRPSQTIGKLTTIGAPSPLRPFEQALRGTEVKLSVYDPPWGPIGPLYSQYLLADLNSMEFRKIFLSGLRESDDFAGKFIQLEADYGQGKGKDVVRALLSDHDLDTVTFPGVDIENRPYQLDDPSSRKETLRVLLAHASFHVTNAMVVSENIDYSPVTDDPLVAELFRLRASSGTYIGGVAPIAPWLGLEIATAVIPDEALDKLQVTDIVEYRSSAKDAYRAWFNELNAMAAEIENMSPSELSSIMPKLKAAKLTPKLTEYTNEMRSIAEKLYGGLIKTFVRYPLPALTVAYAFNLTFLQAITTFTAALSPTVPAIVDYIQARRNAQRKHSMAYLIGVAQLARHKD
jgi:hypothetical protein